MQEHKFKAAIFSYLMTMNFTGSYLNTGAFEISVNGELRYSKLFKHTFPTQKQYSIIFKDTNLIFPEE